MHERRKPVRPWESFESRGTPMENKPTISSISSYLAACYRKKSPFIFHVPPFFYLFRCLIEVLRIISPLTVGSIIIEMLIIVRVLNWLSDVQNRTDKSDFG
jgi:hypothetical protein